MIAYIDFCYLAISLVIIILCIVFISVYLGYNEKVFENLTSHERGLIASDEDRIRVKINFYILAILFIIFDLEIAILFPWAIIVRNNFYGVYYTGFYFLFLLIIGLFYELGEDVFIWNEV